MASRASIRAFFTGFWALREAGRLGEAAGRLPGAAGSCGAPLASASPAWTLPFESLAEGTAPGCGKCLSPPKRERGGGAPSLIAAEVGRDRSQPPFSASGADGRGHRQKKKKKLA